MTAHLLDVNVLIALLWEDHEAHIGVQKWFRQTGRKNFATCGITQSGFIRILSNPKFSSYAITINEARQMLEILSGMAGHTFWPIDIGFSEATAPFESRLFGHRQVTDAYLLGLAVRREGILVTLDLGVRALAGEAYARHVLLPI